MKNQDLEDLTLLLLNDADEPAGWMNRWAVSYPVVVESRVSRNDGIPAWQAQLQTAFDGTASKHIAVTAYGAGVSALLSWLYQADINAQRRVCNLILVSPLPEALPDDAPHTLLRARCPCRAALVIGETDETFRAWSEEKAQLWNARLLVSPHPGRLNGALGGWQWGMKLMQEMLLS